MRSRGELNYYVETLSISICSTQGCAREREHTPQCRTKEMTSILNCDVSLIPFPHHLEETHRHTRHVKNCRVRSISQLTDTGAAP